MTPSRETAVRLEDEAPLAHVMKSCPPDIRKYLSEHGASRISKGKAGLADDSPGTQIKTRSNNVYDLDPGVKEEAPAQAATMSVGEGDFACVRFVAREDGKRIAFKEMRPDFQDTVSDPYSHVRWAENEFAILRELKGKGRHFLGALDVVHFQRDGEIVSGILMNAVEGRNGSDALDDIDAGVSEDKFLPEQVRSKLKDTVFQYIEAVADLHDAHVIHGDIAPRNFIHASSGNIVVCDFNQGRFEDGSSAANESPSRQDDCVKLGLIIYDRIVPILKKLPPEPATEKEIENAMRLANQLIREKGNIRSLLRESYLEADKFGNVARAD